MHIKDAFPEKFMDSVLRKKSTESHSGSRWDKVCVFELDHFIKVNGEAT